jgi:signal transduction histidine kinase/DNA-binding response OmpR family regulator
MDTRSFLNRQFVGLSLFLIVLTGLGLGLLARHTVQDQLDKLAGSLNEDTARVLRNTLWKDIAPLLAPGGVMSHEGLMARMDHPRLHSQMTAIMEGSELAKVKVYNPQGVCVFSTDPAQIGEVRLEHPAVQAALAGKVSSGLTHRGTFDAFHGQVSDVDLFQSYVPIREGSKVAGVFEVYQNVTRIKDLANRSLGGILVVLMALLSALFVLQYLALRWLRVRLDAKEDALITRNAELAAALDEARQANRLKSEFISTVSHELRTPLTAITGALGLIGGGAVGPLTEPVRDMVGIAHKNSQRLGFLINDLLDMEKLMAGKLQFELKPHLVMPLVEQALESNLGYAQQYGVRFDLQQRVDGAWVEVDPQRLQQVLANLLSNAAKFSPHGALVGVNVMQREGQVRVEVRDHGPGVPQAFRERIFQKFSQADATDARQKSGTGLGLAISRELMDRLGGRIGFDSVEGEGSCFFIELPRSKDPILSNPAVPLTEDRPRILTVEDDLDMARMLGEMLNRAGYLVDCVTTGAEAWACMAQGGYAAVTLDLLLPDMDGLALIKRMRASPSTAALPVVVVSVRSEEARAVLDEQITGVVWIAKPLDQPSLLAGLNRLLSTEHPSHPRVLHVEDDAQDHQTVRRLVSGQLDFELVTSLREARARVALERFDAVLLDIGLPNESGWDLLADIRVHQPRTRVVVLTGGELPSEGEHQVDAVLSKSHLSAQQLLEAIGGRRCVEETQGDAP